MPYGRCMVDGVIANVRFYGCVFCVLSFCFLSLGTVL